MAGAVLSPAELHQPARVDLAQHLCCCAAAGPGSVCSRGGWLIGKAAVENLSL